MLKDNAQANGISRRTFVVASAGACVAAAAALAGCGSDASDDSAATDDADEAESSDAAEETEAASAPVATDDNPYALVEAGKLTVGSDCDYPPFIWMEGEQPAGFEYELMKEICSILDLELNYLAPQKFDTIVPSIVVGGKMDVGVSSITITDERLEEIAFTDAYCDSNQSITVLKDSGIESRDDLVGKTVAVHSGTTGEAWAKENLDATIVPYDDQSSAFAALSAGKADAFCEDLPIAQYMVAHSYPDCVVLEEIPTGEQYAIAVSKDNEVLLQALNNALAQLQGNGTVDRLYEEYISG